MINTLKAAALSLGLIMPLPAMAQDYKNLDLFIGFGPTGSYNLYGRLLSRHIGKYLPGNPTVTVKSMPGANGLTLANYLYRAAPQDGTAIGIIARGAATDPLLGTPGANFDSSKFNWIGSANDEVGTCMIFKSTGVATLEDAKKIEVILGGTTAGGDDAQFPYFINKIIGTKFKLVTGYPGNSDVNLAMERGEVQGRCGWSWSSVKSTQQKWLDDKKINILVQLSMAKHPDLPNVPSVMEAAKSSHFTSGKGEVSGTITYNIKLK
jgi:tripartite-type tricarboxylate transporter receptor subunit TctC